MRNQVRRMRIAGLSRTVLHYCATIILGVPGMMLCGLFIATGRLSVHGYLRALKALWRGNVILAANHPSLLESFIIPLLFGALGCIKIRLFLWSMPDRRLFPEWLRWLYPTIRCVPVVRGDRANCSGGALDAGAVLAFRGNVTIHPEGGRTCKGTSSGYHGRVIRNRLTGGVEHLARVHGSWILPTYVDFGSPTVPLSLFASVRRIFTVPMRIYFGEPYQVEDVSGAHTLQSLRDAILTAGVESESVP